MLKRSCLLTTILLISLLSLPGTSRGAGLERSGRWFKYDGAYPYYVGYDLQQLFAAKAYSYDDMDYKLNQLQEFRVNKIRIWTDPWFMGTDAYYPWAVNANGKKNLDVWDNTYWARMRDFTQKCKDRGIVVEVSIFAPYPSDVGLWNDNFYKIAWNRTFNVNGAFSTNSSGHFWPQFFDLDLTERSTSGKTLRDYQKALIDKTIDELKGFGNVYFEIANEFPGVWTDDGSGIGQVYRWQQYWADYMHATKGAITTAHSNEGSTMNTWGIQYFRDRPSVDVLNFHFYADDPDNIDRISDFLHPLQTTGKILQSNESFALEDPDYTDVTTREAWAAFTSGAYYFHYQDTPDIIGTPSWRANAERLKVLRNVAESVSFWQMSAVDASGNEYDTLVTRGPGRHWQVLANPGKDYVVFFSGVPGATGVEMDLPSGDYAYRYFDTRAWNSDGIGSGSMTSHGGSISISAPAAGSWNEASGVVLVIRRASPPYAVSSNIADGQTLSGSVRWTATPSGSPGTLKMEFYVDNVLKWTDNQSPFSFNGDNELLDTTVLVDGLHDLVVRAYSVGDETAESRAYVAISNAAATAARPAMPTGLTVK